MASTSQSQEVDGLAVTGAIDVKPDLTSSGQKRNRLDALMYAIVIGVLVVTMPALFYPGDNFSVRAEGIELLTTGQFGIPFSRRAELEALVETRGQYFYENDTRGRFFSKYGVAYTLLSVLPLSIERLICGRLSLVHKSGSLLLLLNLWSIGISWVVIVYMKRLSAWYTQRVWLQWAFVISSCFGTILWFYLRNHAHDALQLAAFLGFVYHSLVFLRASNESNGSTWRWGHLATSTIWLGLLVHMRFSYALLYAPLWLAASSAGASGIVWRERVRANVRGRSAFFGVSLVLPTLVGLGGLMWLQWWKFGSPFDHGYSQWIETMRATRASTQATEAAWYSLISAKLGIVFRAYLTTLGNYNVFTHYPLIAFSLLGISRFRAGDHIGFRYLIGVLMAILIPVVALGGGGYGYGPRYLLPFLILGSLPVICLVEFVIERGQRWIRIAAIGAIVVAVSISTWLQTYANSIYCFSLFGVAELLEPLAEDKDFKESLGRYEYTAHVGLLNRDLIRYRDLNAPFEPLETVLKSMPSQERERLRRELRSPLLRFTADNYAFFSARGR